MIVLKNTSYTIRRKHTRAPTPGKMVQGKSKNTCFQAEKTMGGGSQTNLRLSQTVKDLKTASLFLTQSKEPTERNYLLCGLWCLPISGRIYIHLFFTARTSTMLWDAVGHHECFAFLSSSSRSPRCRPRWLFGLNANRATRTNASLHHRLFPLL